MPFSPYRILFEDDHLLIVDKLSKELVVRGKGKMRKLPLLDLLKEDYPGLRAVHRLDFETSGALVFAKSKEALDAILKSDFAGWKKIYTTLVMGRLSKDLGVISKKLSARMKGTLVPATTHYRVLERFGNSSLIEAKIETGRHHQIRRHFAAIHHPLVCDDEYGHRKFNNVFTQEFGYRTFFLHASMIEFPHPITGEKVHIESPLPKTFAGIVKKLKSLN